MNNNDTEIQKTDDGFDESELSAMRRSAVITTPEEPMQVKERSSPFARFVYFVTLLCALLALVCFGSFFISQMIQPSEIETRLLASAAVLTIGVPILFRKLWKRLFSKWAYRILAACYVFGVVFFAVTFSLLCIRLTSYSAEGPANRGDTVILVYGCRTMDGEPESMLKGRLDRAYTLLCENPVARCIVSGGVDYGETDSEGEIMARYLERRGIDRSRITVEDKAEDTKGNIRYSLALIRENGWEDAELISVSSLFHMPRIEYLCSRYGLECEFAYAKDKGDPLPSLTREYMSYVKMILLNNYT